MGLRRGPAFVVALALAAAGACRKGPTFTVDRVVVADTPEMQRLGGAGVRSDDLARTASRLLQRAPGFQPPGATGRDVRRLLGQLYVGRAEVRAASGGASSAHVAVALELSGVGGEPPIREVGRASVSFAGGPSAMREAMERAAQTAVERSVDAIAAQLAAERKETSALVHDLASKDARVRDHAMRVLADRGEHDAVPALVARLRDPDPETSERAVGALAQLRDERAVMPLVELARHRDARYVAHLARIIGDIGGADAQAWLLTMAYGHPDAIVREAAQAALTDLSARDAQARVGRNSR